MKYDTSLYMFAIMPPKQLSDNIHVIREQFFQLFKFQKALKTPVHITLFAPFQIPIELSGPFEQYIPQMQCWASTQSPFKIDLYNYDFFSNPEKPVVYIDVIKSQSLKKFYSDFIDQLAKYKLTDKNRRTYTPHITIGYRDVTRIAFPKIKDYYSKQTFSGSFTCNSFYLWKHNGENWQVIKTYLLDGKTEQLKLF